MLVFNVTYTTSLLILHNNTDIVSVAAPTIWKQVPITITYSETIDTFRKKLKTYLFDIAFSTSFRRFHAPMTTFACPHVLLAK